MPRARAVVDIESGSPCNLLRRERERRDRRVEGVQARAVADSVPDCASKGPQRWRERRLAHETARDEQPHTLLRHAVLREVDAVHAHVVAQRGQAIHKSVQHVWEPLQVRHRLDLDNERSELPYRLQRRREAVARVFRATLRPGCRERLTRRAHRADHGRRGVHFLRQRVGGDDFVLENGELRQVVLVHAAALSVSLDAAASPAAGI